MTNSTYNPQRWQDVQTIFVQTIALGLNDVGTAGDTTELDEILSDDVLFRGLEFFSENAVFGDTITLQIIDTDGITGVSPGTVIATPIDNWNVPLSSSQIFSYASIVPFKLRATLTLRFIYSSVGENNVNFSVNYQFLKVLI